MKTNTHSHHKTDCLKYFKTSASCTFEHRLYRIKLNKFLFHHPNHNNFSHNILLTPQCSIFRTKIPRKLTLPIILSPYYVNNQITKIPLKHLNGTKRIQTPKAKTPTNHPTPSSSEQRYFS